MAGGADAAAGKHRRTDTIVGDKQKAHRSAGSGRPTHAHHHKKTVLHKPMHGASKNAHPDTDVDHKHRSHVKKQKVRSDPSASLQAAISLSSEFPIALALVPSQ